VRSRKFDSISGIATEPLVFQCDVGKEEGKAERGERALKCWAGPLNLRVLLKIRKNQSDE